jgi:hypothetical protein
MNDKFIVLLQKRIGTIAIGPSTARRMGPKGTIGIARAFLQKLDLRRFRSPNRLAFESKLDQVTDEFVEALPSKAQHWGAARKFLNIFLRDVVYDRYLCEYYNLSMLESWLELPLDSHVAEGLRSEQGSENLPRWETVIHLLPEKSAKFQEFAKKVADSKNTHRVHLDLLYWRGDHMRPAS